MEFIQNLEAWHWLCLGIFILLGELLGAGGFLLGIGASAIAVSILKFLIPGTAWYLQFIIFGSMSIVLTLLYWKRFKTFNEKTENPLLNLSMKGMIGMKAKLVTDLENGSGKVQIGDTMWTVYSKERASTGDVVSIVDISGTGFTVALER